MMKVSIISHSPKETLALGRILGQGLRAGDVVCLNGILGAGKTVLTKGIGEALGIDQPIISPTFTLIREYAGASGRPPLYHIDLYRLASQGELASLGMEEYLYGDGICVVEWAERAQASWPAETLWIHIDILADAVRRLTCETGDAYLATLPHLYAQEQTNYAAGD
ncbi:MAG: tRNA (adenosine(37)-N6)-threonylcarbamoyltransferase complex ATPase subunit type 1 TsaE [Chloroflexi bacterium]|nr:tRNA (adenosine(37)-N6)-threonylcarbamoyltransferase complex ATPase subunit type 1 TsaE [Chloroflexota bacterium]